MSAIKNYIYDRSIELAKELGDPFLADDIYDMVTTYMVDEVDEEKRLFYDRYSATYFESTLSKVLQAQYHLNRDMHVVEMKDGLQCIVIEMPFDLDTEENLLESY